MKKVKYKLTYRCGDKVFTKYFNYEDQLDAFIESELIDVLNLEKDIIIE
jgi:hypothetical protein